MEKSTLSQILCAGGYIPTRICVSPYCELEAIMCQSSRCQCQQKHSLCSSIIWKNAQQNIFHEYFIYTKKQKSINSLNSLELNLHKMVSVCREKLLLIDAIKGKTEYFNAQKSNRLQYQQLLINAIRNKQYSKITGKLLSQHLKKLREEQSKQIENKQKTLMKIVPKWVNQLLFGKVQAQGQSGDIEDQTIQSIQDFGSQISEVAKQFAVKVNQIVKQTQNMQQSQLSLNLNSSISEKQDKRINYIEQGQFILSKKIIKGQESQPQDQQQLFQMKDKQIFFKNVTEMQVFAYNNSYHMVASSYSSKIYLRCYKYKLCSNKCYATIIVHPCQNGFKVSQYRNQHNHEHEKRKDRSPFKYPMRKYFYNQFWEKILTRYNIKPYQNEKSH